MTPTKPKPEPFFTAEDFWKEFTTLDMIDRGWATLLADFANAKLAPLLEELASAKARLAPLIAENERLKEDLEKAYSLNSYKAVQEMNELQIKDLTEQLRICKEALEMLLTVSTVSTEPIIEHAVYYPPGAALRRRADAIEHRDSIVLKAREALAAVKKLEE